MIQKENLEKIIRAVHNPLNWEDYNSTKVLNHTNCFSHAIGSTITDVRNAYRLGMISGMDNEVIYSSKESVKQFFLDDALKLELEIEEIQTGTYLPFFLKKVEQLELCENEHIVALFVTIYANEKIADFHFLRYDEKGWSEKRWGSPVIFFEDIQKEWPSNLNNRLIGVFKVRR